VKHSLMVGDELINGKNGVTEFTVTKVGRKYIYAKDKFCEMQFISEGNGVLRTSHYGGVTAYTKEGYQRSLLIKELNSVTDIFRDGKQLGWGIKDNVDTQELKSILGKSLELVNQVIEIEKQC
jgi:hypothetical protein